MPQLLQVVEPTYPPLARAARREGTVVVRAEIGEDGGVTDARVVYSVPILDQAALNAVRQWVYAPTIVRGRPVPVVAEVTVNFVLPRP
jgi:protein TonB